MRTLILITLLLFTLVFGIVFSAWAGNCTTQCYNSAAGYTCQTHCW